MTHPRFGRSHLHPIRQRTHTRHSDGSPDPDGSLKEVVRSKICHYRNVYLNRPDPISFLPLVVDTTVRLYDNFILSSRSFIPLPRLIRSRRPTPFLPPSLVLFPPCSP